MWTEETLEKIFMKDGSFPVAFTRFREPQTTPFLIIRTEGTSNIHSDLEMLKVIDTFSLELYYRDPQDRKDFEKFLTAKGFIWERVTADISIGEDGVLEAVYDI